MVSLSLGLVFAVVGWALTFGLWWGGYLYLVLPMATGFMIVSPILALGSTRSVGASPLASRSASLRPWPCFAATRARLP